MVFLVNIPYPIEALFAAFRVSLWFVLLFGFIAPLFLDHTRALSGIEKIIYSWVGLGGVIIFSVFILSVLHIYDFISFVLTLLFIPLIRNIWKSKKGIISYFRDLEIRSIIYQVKFIENFEGLKWEKWKKNIAFKNEASGFKITRNVLIIIIALAGGAIRLYPALINAAPFDRNWFYQLNRVKNIHLQNYFSGYPEPSGMHSLVSIFSMSTQLSPEIILHLLGALSSFFLCIIIYWAVKDVTKNEVPMAPVLAMSVYAITPLLLMPLSLGLQIEANSLDMALCFAIPTITIFTRNLRAQYKSPPFYVLSGFIATGMTNLFVAFIVLLPLMLVGLFSLPRRRYWRSSGKGVMYLSILSIVILTPILWYNYLHGISQYHFFFERMFDTRIYSYNPLIIMPVEDLSCIFIGIAVTFISGLLIEYLLNKDKRLRDGIIFLIIFGIIAFFFSPYASNITRWVDLDQLNNFYSICIAMMIGIVFTNILRWGNKLFRLKKNGFRIMGLSLFTFILGGCLYLQNGIQVSRQLPQTIPNGLYQSYYNIIGDYLPYSYAMVGPEIERINAKNRHYFMNYQYFMNEYDAIDSTYHQQLSALKNGDQPETVPPASIFVFVEKPPYDAIQQGILYDTKTVMNNLEQWLTSYKKLRGRIVKIYYEDKQVRIYEIINRTNESKIGDILWHVYSPGKG